VTRHAPASLASSVVKRVTWAMSRIGGPAG
jgi:hypothetical protein